MMQTAWIAVVAAVVILALTLVRPSRHTARLVVWTALTFFGAFAALGSLFATGEALADPGGWEAAGITALWLVPAAALAAVAWLRPERAMPTLAVLGALVVVVAVWFAAMPGAWRTFEDEWGPVRILLSFAVAIPMAAAGRRHPLASGIMLAVVGFVPPALTAMSADDGARSAVGPMAAVSTPILVTAGLLLAAAWIGRRPLETGSESQPDEGERDEDPVPVTFATPWR